MNQENKMTQPAMPAAIKQKHRPTLILKMPVELKEEHQPGRYSVVIPRHNVSGS